MAANQLHFQVREESGKSEARRLRRQGRIPGVVYGRGEESYALSVDAEEFAELISRLRGRLKITKLVPGRGEPFRAAIKAIQRHPLTEEFLNVDFQKIHPGETMHVSIPIHTEGTPIGLKSGGLLEHIRYEVDVRGPVAKLPLHVDVDITDLELGDAVRIRDLDFAEEVEVLDPPQAVVVAVVSPRRLVEVAAEEEEEAEEEAEEGAEGEAAEETAEKDEGEKSGQDESKE